MQGFENKWGGVGGTGKVVSNQLSVLSKRSPWLVGGHGLIVRRRAVMICKRNCESTGRRLRGTGLMSRELNSKLPFDCLISQIGHCSRVTFKAKFLDLRDTRRTVRFEDQPEDFGDDVVEFLAGLRIGEFSAAGATLYLFFDAARAHLAPGCLCVLAASLAFAAQVGAARAAVKPAVRDQRGLHLDG